MEEKMVRLANALVRVLSFSREVTDVILLSYGIGYVHICPVCMKSVNISDSFELNIQKVVNCECCGNKYITKVGKARKNIIDAVNRSKWNLY